MNAKQAKKIKRIIYGEMSTKVVEYVYRGGTRICTGLRREYQHSKKLFYMVPGPQRADFMDNVEALNAFKI